MKNLEYAIRSREIVDLVNALNSGNLVLQAFFQRNLVWRDVHRREFIETILEGLPFPQIFLARGGIDVDTLRSHSCVVDGQQRLTAIRDYVASEFPVKGKLFSELTPEEKSAFLKYEVAIIDFDLEPDNPLIGEIFQRLNRTYYSLSAVEKLSAEFSPSELMIFAKTLIGEYQDIPDGQLDEEIGDDGNPFVHDPNLPVDAVQWAIQHGQNAFADLILSNRIFSATDVSRKVPLMAALNIYCSTVDGYYNRNNEVKRYLDEFKENVPDREFVFSFMCSLATEIFDQLDASSLWLNKANFYSVSVECLKKRREGFPFEAVKEALEGATGTLSDDYLLAAREGVNNNKERQLRGNFIANVIDGVLN